MIRIRFDCNLIDFFEFWKNGPYSFYVLMHLILQYNETF